MLDSELTLSATEFKAKCLELFKRLESGSLRRIIVTRHDSPIAEIGPSRSMRKSIDEVMGCMRGTVTIAPNVDLTEPAGDPTDWDAERGILLTE